MSIKTAGGRTDATGLLRHGPLLTTTAQQASNSNRVFTEVHPYTVAVEALSCPVCNHQGVLLSEKSDAAPQDLLGR